MTRFFEKHLVMKRIVSAICAYLAVLSISKIFSLNSDISNYFTGMYWGYNIGSVAVFLGGGYCLNRFLGNENTRLKIISAVSGLLLSASCVYGAYAHYVNDIFISSSEAVLQLFLIAGIGFLTIPLSAELFLLFEKGANWFSIKKSKEDMNVPAKKPGLYFLCAWAIIFASYIPLFLANWPGNFIYDAKYQIRDVVLYTHSTHHPLLHTLFMGWAYNLGIKMGNVSAGFQFYTLIQMLVLAASFAYCLLYMYKKKVYRGIRIAVFLWFAFFPMNPLFAITATKDVLFTAFFLFSIIFYVRMFYDREQFKWYTYVGMIISNILLSVLRNNALYAIILFLVIGLFISKGWKEKIKILLLIVIIYVVSGLCNEALIRSVDATEPDTYRETLGVPLQCLARVAAYKGNELDEIDYNEICHYIRGIDLPNYNPYISDPIKNTANEAALRDNTGEFFKLWAKIGLKYPDEYFESIVTNTLGYWYPFNAGGYVTMDVALYHTLVEVGPEITKENYFPLAGKLYNDLFYLGNYKYTPVLGYMFRMPIYVWFYLYACFNLLYKKDKKGLLLISLPLIYFLTCLAGPTVAIRYIYNMIVSVPIFIYILINSENKTKK